MESLVRRCCLSLTIVHIALASLGAQPFRVDTVARAPASQFPVSIAFAPGGNGRLLFTEKITGRVRAYDRSLLPTPFVTVGVDADGEQGLLGVAFHPRYPDSPYVYLYYTRAVDRANILERYRDSSGTGVDPRLLLIVPRLDGNTTNNGGCLRFGPDDKLYLSVGDFGSQFDEAQNTTRKRNFYGKILRLNDDGTIPVDNPIPDRAMWSYGHRNVLGFDFDAVTGTMYCTDDSQRFPNTVNVVPRGANLGWPEVRDGNEYCLYRFAPGPQPGLTGIVVYSGRAFPRLRGKLVFGGYADPAVRIGTLISDGRSLAVDTLFRTNAGFADIEVGPDGSIYLVNGPYISSRILRLVPVAPAFASEPVTSAFQDSEYVYTATFRGTPPELRVVAGPDGMTVDTVSWTVRWTPTASQANAGFHTVTLRATNGAGYADQTYTVNVTNVNDPPAAFRLRAPEDNVVVELGTADSLYWFRWEKGSDPDLDTLRYLLEVDTTMFFMSSAHRSVYAGTADSAGVVLLRQQGGYYWRVTASDGVLSTVSSPAHRHFVTRTPEIPSVAREERAVKVAVSPEIPPKASSPRAGISYKVMREGQVRVSVFNLLGQEIAVLFEGTQQEGTYTVDFDGDPLPAGIYVCRIQAPGYFDTQKMVVSR